MRFSYLTVNLFINSINNNTNGNNYRQKQQNFDDTKLYPRIIAMRLDINNNNNSYILNFCLFEVKTSFKISRKYYDVN